MVTSESSGASPEQRHGAVRQSVHLPIRDTQRSATASSCAAAAAGFQVRQLTSFGGVQVCGGAEGGPSP